jgi:hypothetical protein
MAYENTPVTGQLLQWAVFAMIAVIEAGLVVKLLLGGATSAALLAAIVVLGALGVLAPRLFDLVTLQVGKEGLRAELRSVERKVEEMNRKLDEVFLHTMSPAMFNNLNKLASEHFGEYEMGSPLERELRHLRDIGYIEVFSISSIPKRGKELSEYVKVSPVGHRFIALRHEWEKTIGETRGTT